MITAVMAQLENVEALRGRVQGAAKLAQLTSSGAQVQANLAVFVLPLGFRGGAASSVTGMFTQALDHMVGVVLMVRNLSDATGAAAQAELDPLIWAVIGAIAGWAPEAAIGVFVITSGELVSIASGVITFQLNFALDDQLRIAR